MNGSRTSCNADRHDKTPAPSVESMYTTVYVNVLTTFAVQLVHNMTTGVCSTEAFILANYDCRDTDKTL